MAPGLQRQTRNSGQVAGRDSWLVVDTCVAVMRSVVRRAVVCRTVVDGWAVVVRSVVRRAVVCRTVVDGWAVVVRSVVRRAVVCRTVVDGWAVVVRSVVRRAVVRRGVVLPVPRVVTGGEKPIPVDDKCETSRHICM